MKIQFCIIRKGKEIFNTTIEAPNYKDAQASYVEILKECEIKIQPFDLCQGIVLTNKNKILCK